MRSSVLLAATTSMIAALFVAGAAAASTSAPTTTALPRTSSPSEVTPPSDGPELAVEIDPLDYFPLFRTGMSLELGFEGHHAIKASAYVIDDFKTLTSFEIAYRHYDGPRLFTGTFIGIDAFAKSVSYYSDAPSGGGVIPTTAWTAGVGVDYGYAWRWGDLLLSAGGGLEAFTTVGNPLPDENAGEHIVTLLFGRTGLLPRAVLTIGYSL